MLVGVYLDPRQFSTSSKSAEGLQKVGIMEPLFWLTADICTNFCDDGKRVNFVFFLFVFCTNDVVEVTDDWFSVRVTSLR